MTKCPIHTNIGVSSRPPKKGGVNGEVQLIRILDETRRVIEGELLLGWSRRKGRMRVGVEDIRSRERE